MNVYSYDPSLALCGIVLLPVLFWWLLQRTSMRVKLFGLFMILFFLRGPLNLLQIFNLTLIRYAFELPMVALYVALVLSGRRIQPYKGRPLVAVVVAICVISALAQTSLLVLALYLLYIFEVFMTLLFFRNAFRDEEARSLNRLFVALAVAQIFASFIKFFMVGVMEPYIGTMSDHEGGITTLFALCAFCVSLEMYLMTRRKRYLLLLLGFVLFGFIGSKRALAFMFPVFFFVVIAVHSCLTRTWMRTTRMFIAGVFVMPLVFVLACRLMPSLNPENEVGGSFDMEYVLEYSDKYNKGEFGGDDTAGRQQAMGIIHAKIYLDGPYYWIFGYGAGSLMASSFNAEDVSSEASMKKYGVGYSIGIGYLWLLVQMGFIATFCYLMLFYLQLTDIWRRFRRRMDGMSLMDAAWCISAILILICVLVVTITYNGTALYLNCCSVLVMWFVTYAQRLCR